MILIIFLYSVAILSEREYINTTQLNLKHNLDVNRAIVRRFNEIRECPSLQCHLFCDAGQRIQDISRL